MQKTEELERLISSLLDGSISVDDHSRLSSLLQNSPENREIYLEYIRLESLLHWETAQSEPIEFATPKPKLLPVIPFPVWAGAVAAMFLAFFGIIWLGTDQKTSLTAYIDHIIQPDGSSYASEVERKAPMPTETIPHKNVGEAMSLDRSSYVNVAIASLHSGNQPADEGVIEYFDHLKRWNRLPSLLKPAEKGVLPASGSSMIGLEKMAVNVDSQTAEVEETVQVLDVRMAMENTSGEKARIFAALKVNQSFGNTQEGAEFGITLKAIRSDSSTVEHELSKTESKTSADLDPSTWSELSTEMVLPLDTQYVVVSLSASKQGPDSILANTSSYYADDLELYLSFDNDRVIGPI